MSRQQSTVLCVPGMKGWLSFGGLSLILVLLSPRVGVAQQQEAHGTVVEVRGKTIEVEVSPFYKIPDEATGTVVAQNEIGRLKRTVDVATVEVATVRDGLVIARVTDQINGVGLQSGFSVSFTPVRHKTGAMPDRGLLQLSTVPAEANVKAIPLRATATGRTLQRPSRSLGPTPVADSLLPGRYRLTVRKAGYRPVRRSMVLRADSVVADTLRLRRKNLGRR